MKFEVVPDNTRDKVLNPGGERGPRLDWVLALLDGKTIKIPRGDRGKLGGHYKTFRIRGLALHSGLISETEVVLWTEPLKEGNGKEGS